MNLDCGKIETAEARQGVALIEQQHKEIVPWEVVAAEGGKRQDKRAGAARTGVGGLGR